MLCGPPKTLCAVPDLRIANKREGGTTTLLVVGIFSLVVCRTQTSACILLFHVFAICIMFAFATRQCAAWASTLITHKHSPKEENQGKLEQKEKYARTLTPFCTNSRLNRLSSSLAVLAHSFPLTCCSSTFHHLCYRLVQAKRPKQCQPRMQRAIATRMSHI